MKLELSDLEQCFRLIVEMLHKRRVTAIETEGRDFYWLILSPDWLDFERNPKAAVGSLDDDFLELRKALDGEKPVEALDLERMAAALKLLAEDLSE